MATRLYESLLSRVERLPSLPEVVDKILEQAGDPNGSAGDLAELIEKDEALASRLLRLVNSPFYGVSRKIAVVRSAVTLLGFRTVRALVLSISVFESFQWADARKAHRFLRFWQHALAVGVAARTLATRLKWPNPEEAFTAGLTHDLGKLVMLQKKPDLFDKACAAARASNQDLTVAEEEVFGISHPHLGGLVAEKWRFPDPLCRAIRHHHAPGVAAAHGDAGGPNLALAVHAANAVAKLSLMGEAGNDHRFALDPGVLETLDLPLESVPELCVRTAQQSIQAFKMFGLRTELRARLLIPLEANEPFARTCLRVALVGGSPRDWDSAILTLRAFGHLVEHWEKVPASIDGDLQPHVVVTTVTSAVGPILALRGDHPHGYPGAVAAVPMKLRAKEADRLEDAGVVTLTHPFSMVELLDAILKCFLDASGATASK